MLIWFRYHADALDNPRVQGLPDDLFKQWVNLQCILAQEKASSAGKIPDVGEVAFRLRKSVEETVNILDRLAEKGLVKTKLVTVCDENGDESVTECDGNGHQNSLFKNQKKKEYYLKNWSKKQYKSDTSTERTRRWRERHKNVTRTPSDQSRADTDTDQIENDPSSEENDGKKKPPRRYSIDHLIDDKDRSEAKRAAAGWDMQYLMSKFNDFVVKELKEYPRYPNKAFIGWVKSFTKGKPP